MSHLPEKYAWLNKEPGHKMLLEALRHYGTLEHSGSANNPNIMAWAQEVGVRGWYTGDAIPWCGLFMGVCAKRAGYPFAPGKLLAAREWLNWGEAIPKGREMLGDIGVFVRPGGGHVAFIIGQTPTTYLIYGGNQQNSVGFIWISRDRFLQARRPLYKIGEPSNIRRIIFNESGEVSENEA